MHTPLLVEKMDKIKCEKCNGAIDGPAVVFDGGHDLLFYHVSHYGGSVHNFHGLILDYEMIECKIEQ
jgi:hypothetical protein